MKILLETVSKTGDQKVILRKDKMAL